MNPGPHTFWANTTTDLNKYLRPMIFFSFLKYVYVCLYVCGLMYVCMHVYAYAGPGLIAGIVDLVGKAPQSFCV